MNNPPAFPRPFSGTKQFAQEGMTLRDYMAAQALANPYTYHDGNPDKVAEWAYSVADAMMLARQA